MKPLELKIVLSDKLSITMPEVLANLIGVKSGDSVYVNLENIRKEITTQIESIPQTEKERGYLTALDTDKRKFERSMATNPFYKKTYERLMKFTENNAAYPREPQKSMRAFYTPRGGLCWLEYRSPGPRPFVVHLAKGDYTKVDNLGKVTYSSEATKTWGDYPIFQVSQESDIEYLAKLVKFAITTGF